jgi:hypothetical protein
MSAGLISNSLIARSLIRVIKPRELKPSWAIGAASKAASRSRFSSSMARGPSSVRPVLRSSIRPRGYPFEIFAKMRRLRSIGLKSELWVSSISALPSIRTPDSASAK